METFKNIYDLDLHESVKHTGDGIDIEITRVPGGWIYNFLTINKDEYWESNLVFVRFDNEFFPID